ncbi:hypothetical protein KCU93_g3462, partial [Aureobasidium melanogenum]
MVDDISNANTADSGQNGDPPPDGDTTAPLEHRTLSKGLMAELTRFFNLCNAVDDIADHRDALNAIANAHYAALNNHEQATNVDMHTIDLDVLTSLDDHVEWFRLNNMALENVPEIYTLSSNVIAREEELTAIERDIRARFGAELTENAEAEMAVQFEDVTRDLAFNRDGLLARCRVILGMATAAPASSTEVSLEHIIIGQDTLSVDGAQAYKQGSLSKTLALFVTSCPTLRMDDSSKDTNQPAADAATTEKPQRYSLRRIIMSNTLETLLNEFAKTNRELTSHLIKMQDNSDQAYEAEKAFRRIRRRTRTDLQMIDLDNVTTLDNHVRLLDLQAECIKREIEENAEVRLFFAKLDKLAALGTEIMDNHNSELGKLPAGLRKWVSERREFVTETLVSYSEYYRNILFEDM